MLWGVVGLIFGAGFIGGLVNSLIEGELQLPHRDSEANVFRPGWVGSCLVGGIAAVSFWGLYGPFADLALIGGTPQPPAVTLRVGELFGSLVTGIGGGKLLLGAVERRGLENQRDVLAATKVELGNTLRRLSELMEKMK
ncbi:MAG: hypothetical protein ABL986_23780 [Vicinamibacterales bacterium]